MKPLLTFVLFGAISMLFPKPAAAETIDVFPGQSPTSALTTDDLQVHRMSEEFYTEAWYFMAELDDGSHIFAHFGISNAGMGDFSGAVEITIIDADGTIHFDKTQVKSKYMEYTEGKLDVRFGEDHSVSGDLNSFTFKSKGEEVTINLTVKAVIPGLKFGDGKTWFGEAKEEFYALSILTPRGTISGTIDVAGATRNVTGHAYSDHAWQNYPAHNMADRLFSMRSFDDDKSATFLVFVTPDKTLIPTAVVTEGNAVTLASHQFEISESDATADEKHDNYMIPGKISFKSTGGTPFNGEITMTKRLQRQDAVAEFNFFERTMIKMFVARPMLYRFLNDWTVNIGEGEAARTVGSKGVSEVMILRAD